MRFSAIVSLEPNILLLDHCAYDGSLGLLLHLLLGLLLLHMRLPHLLSHLMVLRRSLCLLLLL